MALSQKGNSSDDFAKMFKVMYSKFEFEVLFRYLIFENVISVNIFNSYKNEIQSTVIVVMKKLC